MTKKDLLQVIGFILICQIAGGVGSLFTAPAIDGWYAQLAKPEFSPPNWVFGPVWTILFTLMGVAAYLVWKKGTDRKAVRQALWVFAFQLVLNVCWSLFFFYIHSPGAAFLEIIALWLCILATILAFYKLSRPAAWILLPYLAWVSFAGCLNFAIWQLNMPTQDAVACNQDAMMCPDGTIIGRTGPTCEFVCPGE